MNRYLNSVRALGLVSVCLFANVTTGQQPAAEEPAAAQDQASEVADLAPAVNVSDTPRIAQTPAASPAQRSSSVVDRLDLGTTSITGNQELPKVLYIVPWKRSDLGNLVGRPVNTLLDEVLAPIDPEVFERHLDYYDTLYGESEQE
jgi:hypothetical protein